MKLSVLYFFFLILLSCGQSQNQETATHSSIDYEEGFVQYQSMQDSLIESCMHSDKNDIGSGIPNSTTINLGENILYNSQKVNIGFLGTQQRAKTKDSTKLELGINLGFMYQQVGVKKYSEKEKFEKNFDIVRFGKWYIVDVNGMYYEPDADSTGRNYVGFQPTILKRVPNGYDEEIIKGWITFTIPNKSTPYKLIFHYQPNIPLKNSDQSLVFCLKLNNQ